MFQIGPTELISLGALLLACLTFVLNGRKGQSQTEQELKVKLAELTVLIEAMSKDIKTIQRQLSDTEESMTDRVNDLQKRNSESHAKLHEKIDLLTKRVTELEHQNGELNLK